MISRKEVFGNGTPFSRVAPARIAISVTREEDAESEALL
jgi:hypothetical protein